MSRISQVYKNFRWNYEPELVGEDCWDEASEVYKLRSEILVSARAIGNVSQLWTIAARLTLCGSLLSLKRMANQPSVRIAFFAKRHIPPLTELRDDYGMYYDTGEVDEDRSMVFRGKMGLLMWFGKLSYLFWVKLNFLLLLLLLSISFCCCCFHYYGHLFLFNH